MRWFKRPDPYAPHTYSKWWPMILTFHWWNWCLAHGWNSLARERIRIYYVRRAQRQMRRPICWLIGHKTYRSTDWSWDYVVCARCRKVTKRFR